MGTVSWCEARSWAGYTLIGPNEFGTDPTETEEVFEHTKFYTIESRRMPPRIAVASTCARKGSELRSEDSDRRKLVRF